LKCFPCGCSSSAVTPNEIERLSKRFKKLDLDHSGAISVNEFYTAIPELKDNPLFSRVITLFDTDGNGEIDFEGMIKANHFVNEGLHCRQHLSKLRVLICVQWQCFLLKIGSQQGDPMAQCILHILSTVERLIIKHA